ncbi:TetR/AcrR family transcriptional regulator [Alicyclobacillus sp. SO9]|nr:TetR/AcrR family transcriptional regulator [Alicyclobacillus sp. SO9]
MKKSHADSKENEIVNAAIRLFSRRGIEGTSVREIGREAGVTDAAIYKHFESKDNVALSVFSRYSDRYSRLVDYYRQLESPFEDRLNQMIVDILEQHDRDRFGLLLLGQRHEIFARLGTTHRFPIIAMTDFIQLGIEEDVIPKQSARLTAALVIGAFTRLAVFSDMGGLPSTLIDMKSEIQERIRGLVGLS